MLLNSLFYVINLHSKYTFFEIVYISSNKRTNYSLLALYVDMLLN